MKAHNPMLFFLCLLQLALFAGCGSDTGQNSPVSTLAASQRCINCHAGNDKSISPVTGAVITDEWKSSAHNTESAANKTGYGSGCRNCHGPAHNHPASCGGCHGGSAPVDAAFLNPDKTRQCNGCHAPAASVRPLGAPHFNNITSPANAEGSGLKRNGYPASFVTSREIGKCRNCHNPHNPTGHMQTNKEWAQSGHGNVNGEAWTHYDFKAFLGTAGANPAVSTAFDCVRCHTTTGYLNYITSGFTNIGTWGDSSDKTKETLQCNACHDKTYDFGSQRRLGAITAFYNYSSTNTKKLLVSFTFPDVGKSNLCMCCHTARETGLTLAAIAALPAAGPAFVNYSAQSFVNSHYLAAGATLFSVSGYEFPGRNYADPPLFTHLKLGTATLPNGSAGVGPCVTCHMQVTSAKASHTFRPELTNGAGANCVGCHAANAAAFPTVPLSQSLLETRQAGYNSALAVLASALKKRGFTFQSNSPYFTNRNWQTSRDGGATGGYGPGLAGANTMGAAFNFNLFVHDPGGFAHNSTYAKRLLYDSIVWIATGNADPAATGNTIASIIGNTTLVPDDPALVATTDGIPINFPGTALPDMRATAIAWLTNGTGARP